MPTFDQLKAEFDKLWSTMTIEPDKAMTVTAIAKKLIEHRETYEAVEADTGVPWIVIAALHNRESNTDFATYLGNGEPLDRVTRLVPAGRGPFNSFEEGAIDAIRYDGLDQVDDWTPERACYEIEKFNGFGYRNNHPDVKSPYLWSFSNHYTQGKYVADGHFSATAVDQQCGAIPILKRIIELDGASFGDDDEKSAAPAPRVGKRFWRLLLELVALFAPRLVTPRLVAKSAAPVVALDLAGRIVQAMKRRGYRVATAPGQMNIVYMEGMGPDGTKNDNAPNEFNDARFVIGFESGQPKILGAWEATTEPSRHWTLHPMNPKGAARIKFGQYAAWQVGEHHGHEALVQTGGPVTVCRDLNKDFKRDDDAEDTGMFGINQHWGYDLPKDDLGTSSAGCLVGRTRAGHRAFMALVKSDPRYVANHAYVFEAAVLPASEI